MGLNYFFIKDGKNNIQIFYDDILYIEACKKYSKLVTAIREYLLPSSLNEIEDELSSLIFCRVHKSYIISLNHTSTFTNEVANVGARQIPIGRCYRGLLLQRLFGSGRTFVKLSKKDANDLFGDISES